MNIERSSWWHVPQKLRFLAAGAYNTIFAYAMFAALIFFFGDSMHYLVIATINYAVAVCNAFLVHRFLVFRSEQPWVSSFIRFNVSQSVTLALGMAMLYGLVEYGKLRPLAAQSVVLVVSVLLSYTLHRYFSFTARETNRSPF